MTLETRPLDPLVWIDTEEAIMENAPHTKCRFESADALWWKYRGQDVFVGSGLAIQMDEEDPSKMVSPDVFIVTRPPPGGFPPFSPALRSWKTWEYGAPIVVIEITSKSTVANDLGVKFADYQDMGIEEYYLFDPCYASREERSLPSPLLGYRRESGEFVPLPVSSSYESALLGLKLEAASGSLVFYDLATGRRIEPSQEVREIRSKMEVEIVRLTADIARLVADNARLTADDARLTAENARNAEKIEELAAEVAHLRARFIQFDGRGPE